MDQFNFVISVDKDTLDFMASVIGSVLSWPVALLIALWIFHGPIWRLIERIKEAELPGLKLKAQTVEQLGEASAEATDAVIGAVSSLPRSASEPTASTPASEEPTSTPTPESKEPTSTPTPEAQEGVSSTAETPAPEKTASTNKTAARYEQAVAALVAALDDWESPLFPQRASDLRYLQRQALANDEDAPAAMSAAALVINSYGSLERAIIELDIQQGGDKRAQTVQRVLRLFDDDVVDEAFLSSFRRLRRIRGQVAHGQVVFTASEAQAFALTASKLQKIVEAKTVFLDD